MNFKLTVR